GQSSKNDKHRADKEEEGVLLHRHADSGTDERGPNEQEAAQRRLDEEGQGEIVPPALLRIPTEQEGGLASVGQAHVFLQPFPPGSEALEEIERRQHEHRDGEEETQRTHSFGEPRSPFPPRETSYPRERE